MTIAASKARTTEIDRLTESGTPAEPRT
jgi:hypothetical protein